MPDPIDVTVITHQLAAWRGSHPEATLTEIETEVDRALAAFRNQTVGALAHAAPTDTPPRCPACARSMQRHGIRSRTLVTRDEGQVDLSLPRYRCPSCGTELSPPG